MEKIKNWFLGCWNWLIVDKVRLVLLIAVVSFFAFQAPQVKSLSVVEKAKSLDIKQIGVQDKKEKETVKKKIEKPLIKKAPTAECSPQEAKIILSDSQIAKQMNLLVIDLNSFTVKNTESVKAYFTKEELFGVKRELIPKSRGKSQFYVTIYEPIDNLLYNKKEYSFKEKENGLTEVGGK